MFYLECQTEDTKENCIFPFNFGGKKYNSCTKDHSENGLPWCATAVYRNGTVIKNRWGDCSIGNNYYFFIFTQFSHLFVYFFSICVN